MLSSISSWEAGWLVAYQLVVVAIALDLGASGPQHNNDANGQCEKDTKDADCQKNLDADGIDHRKRGYLHPEWVHVGIVACGNRQPEASVAIKAIMLTATQDVFVHVFSEDSLRSAFEREFDSWPAEVKAKFSYKLYPITYPPEKFDEWKKLFKTCATQRLFIPTVLTNVDSILYIDTDILLMRPVQDVWAHFKKFNSTQLAAVAPEHETSNAGWYNRFARHPYYGRLGINSGVMLMNLTRIRAFTWLDHINQYFETYKYNITWGDQDLLNVLFHYYPEFVYIYDCSWNYRPDHCMYMSVCHEAERDGISVVHGNRGVLHNDKEPIFRAVYDSFNEYRFDGLDKLVNKLKAKLNQLKYEEGRCQAVKNLFYKQLVRHIA